MSSISPGIPRRRPDHPPGARTGSDLEIIGSDALISEYFWRVAGPAAVGVRFVSSRRSAHQPRAAADRRAIPRARVTSLTGLTRSSSYAAVQVWAQAVERAGSLEPKAVVATLHSHQFRHRTGPDRLRRRTATSTGFEPCRLVRLAGGRHYVPLESARPRSRSAGLVAGRTIGVDADRQLIRGISALFERTGVRGRLLLAFLGISAFAVIAAAAGLYSFGEVGRSLGRITEERVPGALASLELSRQAERIVAAAPALLAVRSEEQLRQVSGGIPAEVEKLGRLLEALRQQRPAPGRAGPARARGRRPAPQPRRARCADRGPARGRGAQAGAAGRSRRHQRRDPAPGGAGILVMKSKIAEWRRGSGERRPGRRPSGRPRPQRSARRSPPTCRSRRPRSSCRRSTTACSRRGRADPGRPAAARLPAAPFAVHARGAGERVRSGPARRACWSGSRSSSA